MTHYKNDNRARGNRYDGKYVKGPRLKTSGAGAGRIGGLLGRGHKANSANSLGRRASRGNRLMRAVLCACATARWRRKAPLVDASAFVRIRGPRPRIILHWSLSECLRPSSLRLQANRRGVKCEQTRRGFS